MKILFTGFTSRTVGSDQNVYDYLSNVDVLHHALKLAGHTVDRRIVSLETDPCPEEDYDVALVGIAACQGLASRYKLGALWALRKFGSRAGLFPSDGKNIYVFPSSVQTCLTGEHYDKGTQMGCDPIDYFLGQLQQERNNVFDVKLGREMKSVWRETLEHLPHGNQPTCAWPMLVPTFSWGNPSIYARHFGAQITTWDPTRVAIPMQFGTTFAAHHDGRYLWARETTRQRAWIVSSLQDQSPWIKRQNCKWPVIVIGNKRQARRGEALEYVSEIELIRTYYRDYWGHLAFGYPLADGGWWRMRYVHAALTGIVTCCDEADARRMPDAYRHSRMMLERWSDEKLAEIARDQHVQLMATATPADQVIEKIDQFVKGLV